jgi:UDP-N-acetylmuramoyl-tripeptide--D-alanyl-D-alanine ligase
VPRLTIAELVRGTQGALVGGRLEAVVSGVSIDSRTCGAGDVFFAIRGPRQDGHAFVGHARARGAGAAVVTHLPPDLVLPPDFPVVVVEDTTSALQRLGAFHRRRQALPVVAVTGSNGKTTTKELAAAVLARRLRVLKAAGSLNNQWGVPLTLLGIEPDHQAVVLELGMNAFGEIAALAQIAQPTVGVVTVIAPAHLEGVGSLEGVQKAKGELVEAIAPDGVVILNQDDPLVAALATRARARVVTYGRAATADVRLGDVTPVGDGLLFSLSAGGGSAPVRLPLCGRHNAWNAAAAAAVGLSLGVSLADAAGALERVVPVKGRLVWREAGASGSSTTPTTPPRPRSGPPSTPSSRAPGARSEEPGSCSATCSSWASTRRLPIATSAAGSRPFPWPAWPRPVRGCGWRGTRRGPPAAPTSPPTTRPRGRRATWRRAWRRGTGSW